MKNNKFKLGIILFLLGFAGVLTTLTGPLPMDSLPQEVTDRFSESALRILLLINPTVLLIMAVVVGVLLYDKVKFDVPVIKQVIQKKAPGNSVTDIIKSGVLGGLASGVLLFLIGVIFSGLLPQEFNEIEDKINPTPLVRLLYGGITEEILLRFGFMTLIVWFISKLSSRLNPAVYWIGLIISSVGFAVGHFPIVYQSVGNPSTELLWYILMGNSLGGLIFGWLYWRKGLEAAIIAHMFAHIVMMAGEEVCSFC